MVTLHRSGNNVTVSVDGAPVGSVRLYDNPCHKQNRYLELRLTLMDGRFAAELFEALYQTEQRPLQVMVESTGTQTVDFLTAGGFICKRKCYEVEAERRDWNGSAAPALLQTARKGTDGYELCCQLTYDHYVETHREVNPWTAGYSFFLEALPDVAVYETADGRVVNAAFVEGNEIAYLYSGEPVLFPGFAAALAESIFSEYDALCFESDDCDPAAMALRAMFADQSGDSFDTYVYKI